MKELEHWERREMVRIKRARHRTGIAVEIPAFQAGNEILSHRRIFKYNIVFGGINP